MKIAPSQKQLHAVAVATAAAAVFVLVAWICTASTRDMNACRLAQIVGMHYGFPLYPDPIHGVMSPWTFGPVPAMLFLLSSIFVHPTSQLLAAVCINASIVLGSSLWLNLRFAGKENRAFGWLAFLVLVWCLLTHDSLGQIAFAVTPDGPMLALTACAIALLLKSPTKLQLAIAAVAMTLAIWCKASAFPLVMVPALYLMLVGGRQTIGGYFAAFAIAIVVVSAVFLASFGARNMWSFMVTLPMNQPWANAQRDVISDGKLSELTDVVVALLHDIIPTLGLLVATLLLGRFLSNPNHSKPLRDWLKDNPWIFLPAMALLSLPAAVLGYLKMGRHSEAFGAVHYFILMTAMALLIRGYRACRENSARSIFIACICIFSVWQAMAVLLTWHRPANLFGVIRNTYSNPQETAYTFARDHPGEVFFPLNTLSTLTAEGKLYHSEVGFNLYYRAHPNERVDVDRIHQFTPDRMRFVAFPEQHESERIRLVFLQASQPASIAQLPGFIAYTQTASK